MAQVVLGAVGAVVGGYFGGPAGAQAGWAIGSAIGAAVGPKQRTSGPKLDDLRVGGVEYGQPIPWIAGHPRLAGQLWWASDRHEIATTTSQGKGGGPEHTSFSYEIDLLIGLVDREIQGVSRVWLNGKLVYGRLDGASQETLTASVSDAVWRRITVYTGAATQLPDPVYEAAVGVGAAPAYRGRGSVFIEGLQLGSSGQLPNLTFEVFVSGDETPQCVVTDPDVLLQLCMEGAHASTTFIDSSTYGHAVSTRGTAQVTTADKRCGLGSLILQPGGALVVDVMPQFEDAEATIRFFFKNIATGDGVWVARATAGAVHGWRLRYESSFQRIYLQNFSVPSGGVYSRRWVYAGGFTVWREVVLVLGLFEASLYIDGVLQTPDGGGEIGTYAITYVDGTPLTVGKGNATESLLNCNGYFDDVQVIARALAPEEITGECTSAISTVVLHDDSVRNVVEALCTRAGLASADVDASALSAITRPVRAYAVASAGPVRTALEQLAAAYFFECVESDKLRFRVRGGASAATLSVDDLGAGAGDPETDLLPMTVASDLEMPAQVALAYSNVDADYNTAVEHSDRLLTGQVSTAQVQLPLSMTSSEAKGVVDAMVVDGYASRVSGRLSLAQPTAAGLEPTDVVIAPDADGNTYRVRIVRSTYGAGVAAMEWVLDDVSALASAGITSTDYEPVVGVRKLGATDMLMLDIPLLRDADDSVGLYAALKSAGGTWPGAQVLSSTDGANYTAAGKVTRAATFGVTTTTLATWAGGGVFDEVSSVTVNVGADGTLDSATRDAMLTTGANAALVGSEVIQYRTATLVSPGVYTLTGLLRGRRGTEWAMTGHASGERFVRLHDSGVLRVAHSAAYIGAALSWIGVTLGRSLDSATPVSVVSTAESSRPLPPVDVRASRDVTSGDIVITWRRRSRLSMPASSPVPPLGEASEAYEVDVYGDAGYTTLKRTLSASTPSVVYSAAEQAGDFGGLAPGIWVRVFQISQVAGRSRSGDRALDGVGSTAARASVQYTRTTAFISSGIDTRTSGFIFIKQITPPGVGVPNMCVVPEASGACYTLNTSSTSYKIVAAATANAVGLTPDANMLYTDKSVAAFLAGAGIAQRVEWAGDGGGARDIAHGLGVAPAFALVKRTNSINWWMYSSAAGAGQSLRFPSGGPATFAADAGAFPSLSTTTHLKVGANLNDTGEQHCALLFASSGTDVADGTYTGNGTGTGPTISLGWEPDILLVRNVNGSAAWTLMRCAALDGTGATHWLLDDQGTAPATSALISVTATGFAAASADATVNESGITYHYWARKR